MKAVNWGGGLNLPGVPGGGRGGCLESRSWLGSHLGSWSCLERRHFQGMGKHLHLCAVWKTGRGAEPGHQSGKGVGKPLYET